MEKFEDFTAETKNIIVFWTGHCVTLLRYSTSDECDLYLTKYMNHISETINFFSSVQNVSLEHVTAYNQKRIWF
jgi:hypothetical protein